MQVKQCRACGTNIVYIKNAKTGRPMPCDAKPVRYQLYFGGKETVMTREGKLLKDALLNVDPIDAMGHGYRPHWATCTKPELFRRAKRVTEAAAPKAEDGQTCFL